MNPRTVNCPQCQAQVPSGAAICPACDQILDESFLDGGAESAPAPTPAVRRRPAGASRPTGPGRAGSGAVRSVRSAPTRPAYDEPEPEPDSTDPGPPPREEPRWSGADDYVADDRPSSVDNEFEQSMQDIKDYVVGLELGDRVALGGAAFTLFCTLLPWRNTYTRAGPDTVIGFTDIGTLCFVLACVTTALLVVRTRSLLPRFNPVMVWSAQLATTGANIFWCLLCLLHYAHQGSDGFEEVAAAGLKMAEGFRPSSPAYGLHLALLGGLGSLGGALLGLRSKPH